MDKFSVVLFKSTRGGETLKKGLDWKEAMDFANNCCDYARHFQKVMASGVAFLIFTDERAAEIDGKGIVYMPCNRDESGILYQAGSF